MQGVNRMADYRTLYFQLFNALTDAVSAVERQNFGQVRDILIQAQQAAEEIFLSQSDAENG